MSTVPTRGLPALGGNTHASYGKAGMQWSAAIDKRWIATIEFPYCRKLQQEILRPTSDMQQSQATMLGNEVLNNFVEQQSCALKLLNFVACLTWA